ncbi:hypothetical protein [Polaribacter atrinae]|uniref:hypothetical protein n=1 Tax=Polaribacter atrinae TaxID=1333662 RepID=UPI0030F89BE3
MKTNKLDHSIKEKLQNRTINPSASAWERLSVQLDEQPKQKKKGWFFYVGAAASILLLISIGFLFLNKNEDLNHQKLLLQTQLIPLLLMLKLTNLSMKFLLKKQSFRLMK